MELEIFCNKLCVHQTDGFCKLTNVPSLQQCKNNVDCVYFTRRNAVKTPDSVYRTEFCEHFKVN